jgi:hypothetical protein
MKKWHWRDVVCYLKLKFGTGYTVEEMCGSCTKCNRIFAAMGCLPCQYRWDKKRGGGR